MATDPTYEYSYEDIARYLSGSMPAHEMYAMEKAALSDPLLADALDGYRNADRSITKDHLNEINSFAYGKNAGEKEQEANNVVAIDQSTNNKWWRGIAAAAVIITLAAGAWFFMNPDKKNATHEVAQNTPAKSIPAPATTDSIIPADKSVSKTISRVKDSASETKLKREIIKPSIPVPIAKAEKSEAVPITQSVPIADMAAPVVKQPLPEKEPATTEIASLRQRRDNYILSNTATSNNKMQATSQETMIFNKKENYFSGKITDASGQPVPGASISTNTNYYKTVSNIDGSFRIPANDSTDNLAIAAVGYEPKIAKVLAGRTAGIVLQQDQASLNDVVIIGMGTKKKAAITGSISRYKIDTLPYKESPYPQGGWNNFYSNLTTEMGVNQGKATKDLHIRFSVENGLPQNFTVIKTPNDITAQKAINIIKKGPKWRTNKRTKKVDVKMKVE